VSERSLAGLTIRSQVEIAQVIKESEEELQNRKEHWHAIQKRAEDPNTVAPRCSSGALSLEVSKRIDDMLAWNAGVLERQQCCAQRE
jgi:hypothetical protein